MENAGLVHYDRKGGYVIVPLDQRRNRLDRPESVLEQLPCDDWIHTMVEEVRHVIEALFKRF